MSLETWKAEFYPKKPTKKMTRVEAIRHSLKKWEGTTKKNLDKHKVEWTGQKVTEDISRYVYFDAQSCALCVKYIDEPYCARCPIVTAGAFSCQDDNSVYAKVTENGEPPSKMIALLRRVLKKEMVK